MASNQIVPIFCAQCGKDTHKTIRRLKEDNLFHCIYCGHDLTAERDKFVRDLVDAEKRADDDFRDLVRGTHSKN